MELNEYLKTNKSQESLVEWMQNNDVDPVQDDLANQDQDDEEEPEDPSVNLVEKNVVRKRLLDKLGEKLEILAHTKNNDYYKNNFYDPLSDDL